MLLTVDKISKTFGADIILKDVGFVVNRQDRIGVIGQNGAGKTTLIKIIIGSLKPDNGEIIFAKNTNIGYLEQNSHMNAENTVYSEMKTVFDKPLNALKRIKELNLQISQTPNDENLLLELTKMHEIADSCDAYQIDTKINKVLNGMDFPKITHDKLVSVLSGGEYTRLSLAKLLLKNPDILLLDEPTNHLDFKTMEWLEDYLISYSGAVFVISHDRFFLDKVCNKIIEVENNSAKMYKGNFSAFTVQKEEQTTLLQKQHEADVKKAEKLEDYIARNLVRASTTKMAQSRRKQLEKLQITEKPTTAQQELKFEFLFDVTPYKEVLTAKNISKILGDKQLIKNFDFKVLKGERIVIAGPNGTGKSTLLRILNGALRPDTGSVMLGAGAKTSVFEQQQLRQHGTVLSTIWDKNPKFDNFGARSYLARFNFKGEDVEKPCNALSGGELARLRLAEMVLDKPNVLFMDEPTNHLDIYTRESLTVALNAYEGTLIIVTHDRYLMNTLSCPILYVENNNIAQYESYEKLMKANTQENAQLKQKANVQDTQQKQNFGKEQRQRKAKLRLEIKEYEDLLSQLDIEINELEIQLNSPENLKDHIKINELCEKLDIKREEHENAFMKWDMLVDEQKNYE